MKGHLKNFLEKISKIRNSFAEKKVIKRTWRKLMPIVIPPIGKWLINFIWLTCRKLVTGLDKLEAELSNGNGVIIAFWHGRMFLLPAYYRRYIRREAHVLISQHRDGELITRTIEGFGLMAIRGSSRRGGKEAMEEMKRKIKEGAIIGITPDGPRGPREKARRGVVELAHLTDCAVFPLGFGASRYKRLNSWDRFVVPAPFSKVAFVLGEPMKVGKNADREEREQLRLELENKLIAVCEEAEALAKGKRVLEKTF